MSARLFKKVLKEQEEAAAKAAAEAQRNNGGNGYSTRGDDGDDDSDYQESSAPSRNLFDLLNDDEVQDDDFGQGNESRTGDESSIGDAYQIDSSVATANAVSAPNQKSKKKKKKKNNKDFSSSTQNTEKSWEVMLEHLSVGTDSSSQQTLHHATKAKSVNLNGDKRAGRDCTSSILQVDPKFLSAENELRRIFGSKVVNSFEKGHQAGGSRQIRGGRRGGHSHKKTLIVSASEHWPRWDGSLSMEFLETRDGIHYFRYTHSPSYIQAQRAFEAAKAIHDLNGIASILLYHPYHVESLITMADYFKFSGEHQMSSEATAKCLYALECAWHQMFTPLQGNCQLKYVHESNRPFFSSLFSHMKNMDRRGCHRSALEICKLLLSLDSDDPMGAMFCIDYYSLRAEEYAWLERFSEEYESSNSLWLFPNFSYSLAICRFYLESEESTNDRETDTTKASSADLMKQALMLHPSVVKTLVAKVPLKDQAWTGITKHNFFRSEQTGSPSLDHLINIYVERSYLIWRLPVLQKFLRETALVVIDMLEDKSNDAKDWACVRKETFSSEKNEYSHLLVLDFSDSVPTLPPENLQNFMVDPRVGMQIGEQVAHDQVGPRAPRDISNRNALAVFLESMLPWMDYGGREGNQPDLPDANEE